MRGQRLAVCLEQLLGRAGFCVNRQGGLVGAALTEASAGLAGEALEFLGRLLGQPGALEAAAADDEAPYRVAGTLWDALRPRSAADPAGA